MTQEDTASEEYSLHRNYQQNKEKVSEAARREIEATKKARSQQKSDE